jgi:hypothetical protein
MLQLADAIEQQQLQQQRRYVNGRSSSQAQQLQWQQHGLGLQWPPQQLNGCSSSHQQSSQHHDWPHYAETGSGQQYAAAAAAAAADGVLELDVRGSPVALSEQLELALQHHTAVCMPVVYDKQAAKLLEAAALVNRRWQQQQQLHHMSGSSSGEAFSDASSVEAGVGCDSSSGLQLVLQLQEAWVQRQSGLRPGLHVYVFAAPSVQ